MIYTITGMSSSGKTTLVNELIKQYPNQFVRLKTATTRRKRKNEDDNSYTFLKDEEYEALKWRHDIFLATEFAGHKYGVTYNDYENMLCNIEYKDSDSNILVVLDRNGAMNAPYEKWFSSKSVKKVYINVDIEQKKQAKKRNWRRFKADIAAELDNPEGYDCVIYNDHKSLDNLVYNFMCYKTAVDAKIKYGLE